MTERPDTQPCIDLLSPFLVPPSRDDQHRLLHGRGGAVPGWDWLTIDRYPPVLVVTLFAAQQDVFPALFALLQDRLAELGCDTLIVQHRYGGTARNELLAGDWPEQAVARENGLG